MNTLNARPWQVSLRMMFVLTAITAVGCAAMTYANEWWALAVATLSCLIFVAAAVTAVIDRGSRQAFAIGFLLCGGLHWAALRWVDDIPTQQLLEKCYYRIGKSGLDVGPSLHVGGDTTTSVKSVGLLQRGDKGDPVRALQKALNERLSGNLLLVVDGDFGIQTEQAVRALQNLHGQPADGIVTLATWRMLGPAAPQALKHFDVSRFLSPTSAEQFLQIGGWLFTLLLAYLGGHLAVAAYTRRWKETASE